MSGLTYREDMDEVRKRLTEWWNGGDIGRPALQIAVPRPRPVEDIPALPKPPGAKCDQYTTKSVEYRVNVAQRSCVQTRYLGEAAPFANLSLGPSTLALYLGCKGVEMPTTVWFEPFLQSAEEPRFMYDRNKFYWDFTLKLTAEHLRVGKGKYLLEFPDLIEGLDTLAAMRGSERLLSDLIDRPEWVHGCLRQVTDRYFHYYDVLYDMIRDEVGGSHFWSWAPGRMAKFQCDFSAMISPAMFREFMVPVLTEMCERVSYCMYHWDGPGAIGHHDHLLSIPKLHMIQWTPGAGAPSTTDQRWWPLYHKTVEAGKKVFLMGASIEGLEALKREFGRKLRQFMIRMQAKSLKEADAIFRIAEA